MTDLFFSGMISSHFAVDKSMHAEQLPGGSPEKEKQSPPRAAEHHAEDQCWHCSATSQTGKSGSPRQWVAQVQENGVANTLVSDREKKIKAISTINIHNILLNIERDFSCY